MKDEIKEILDKAKEISDYGADGKQHTRMFNQFEAKALLDYITNLQQKVDQYENPDDMTLFYMWLDEKAKDKMKCLEEENKRLNNNWNKLEEYIRSYINLLVNNPDMIEQGQLDILYEVLDKMKEIENSEID